MSFGSYLNQAIGQQPQQYNGLQYGGGLESPQGQSPYQPQTYNGMSLGGGLQAPTVNSPMPYQSANPNFISGGGAQYTPDMSSTINGQGFKGSFSDTLKGMADKFSAGSDPTGQKARDKIDAEAAQRQAEMGKINSQALAGMQERTGGQGFSPTAGTIASLTNGINPYLR